MTKLLSVIAEILRRITLALLALIVFINAYACFDIYHIYHQTYLAYAADQKPQEVHEDEYIDKAVLGNKAWLCIDNTNIDYPVMQGKDNQEYLDKNPYGSFSLSGSIFLDSRNRDDFSDSYILIYGHHMDGQTMFGTLDEYYNKDFFMTHQTGKIIIDGHARRMTIFAMGQEDADDQLLYVPGDADINDILRKIIASAEYYDHSISSTKQIVALSTCRSYGYSNERTMVFAWLEQQ